MPDEAREVKAFSLDKNRKSTAPKDPAKKPAEVEEDTARTVSPIIYTKPGEDYYASDDPDAAPSFSDFRPMILPSDSEVAIPGESEAPAPKDLSVLESVTSSDPSTPTTEGSQETTAPEPADKDNGQPKENENSTPTSSSTSNPKPGSSEPPVET